MTGLKQPYMVVDGGRQITVRDASDEAKPFAFDHCFDAREARDAGASQAEVFEAIGKKVRGTTSVNRMPTADRSAIIMDGSGHDSPRSTPARPPNPTPTPTPRC